MREFSMFRGDVLLPWYKPIPSKHRSRTPSRNPNVRMTRIAVSLIIFNRLDKVLENKLGCYKYLIRDKHERDWKIVGSHDVVKQCLQKGGLRLARIGFCSHIGYTLFPLLMWFIAIQLSNLARKTNIKRGWEIMFPYLCQQKCLLNPPGFSQNRPLYSCLLSDLAFEWKWGWRWPYFDTDLAAFVV